MMPASDTPLDKIAQRIGYGGLIPFAGLSLLLWLVTPDLMPFVGAALAAYGGAIVSFLGGIHWGIAFVQKPDTPHFHLVWGVVPSLLGWVAVMMPASAGLPLLGLVLVACYAVDRKTYPAAGLSHWLPLRLHLTLVATLSCVLGAAAL